MSLSVRKIIVGVMEANCYLVGDGDTKEVFIIDPGADFERVEELIVSNNLKPIAIINTHGHGDHIGANSEFNLPIWIHRLDAGFLQDPVKNLSGAFGLALRTTPAARLLEDGDILYIGREKLYVIHTPGHTPGSICLKANNIIFTGDTLFCGGIGRTDFEYGSEKDIIQSIRKKLLIMDDDCVIYPGHGPESTIGNERHTNPFLI